MGCAIFTGSSLRSALRRHRMIELACSTNSHERRQKLSRFAPLGCHHRPRKSTRLPAGCRADRKRQLRLPASLGSCHYDVPGNMLQIRGGACGSSMKLRIR
ncbi:hypothetical protein CALCODRAFT_82959 [Calocera cornea HHB12733]|uniref:Uncharacterized protein n=1 Tax=Calocera cornea HHB12733 TaxID=1353952 RepID=A0A165DDJ7_9BASI|nr:hypothetical protein CALCODRAFT_82959 [Calocera cornea HHB12733]